MTSYSGVWWFAVGVLIGRCVTIGQILRLMRTDREAR